MSTLSSTSTLAQVEAAYIDNASYAEDSSVAKAKAFITACRILLVKLPKASNSGDAGATYNTDLIQKQMEQAQQWVTANDTSSSSDASSGGPVVARFNFNNFR